MSIPTKWWVLRDLFAWAVDTIGVFNDFARWLIGTSTNEVIVPLAITQMRLRAGTALDVRACRLTSVGVAPCSLRHIGSRRAGSSTTYTYTTFR